MNAEERELYKLARSAGYEACEKGIRDNPYSGNREQLWECIAWSNGWVLAHEKETT